MLTTAPPLHTDDSAVQEDDGAIHKDYGAMHKDYGAVQYKVLFLFKKKTLKDIFF